MDRRSFLVSAGTLTLAQMLAGCSSEDQASTLQVQLLKDSIPTRLVNEFRQQLNQSIQTKFTPVEQLQELFKQLQSWQQKPVTANQGRALFSLPRSTQPVALPDLVTLGDYWLSSAIEQNLIQPLDPAKLRNWATLPSRWQELVKRNAQGELDAQAQVWAAPYRAGNTVIVYNRDKFKTLGWTPKDWSDLWRKELRSHISLLDHSREVIGLTLKHLGQSYNTQNLDQVPDLEKQLRALHQQTLFYSSNQYLEPLIIGDTWLAVAWSIDVIPVLQRYQELAAIVPQSGTALWADLWVRPANDHALSTLAQQWIDFCWQPQTAQEISLLSKATSPIPVNFKPNNIQPKLRSILLPNPQIWQRSEFLLPLAPATKQQYDALWQKIRTNT